MTQIKKSFVGSVVKRKVVSVLGKEIGAAISYSEKNSSKTGNWRFSTPIVSPACMACELCVRNCPEGGIQIKETRGRKQAVIDYSYCKGCGICADICPVKAIETK